jgi:hypothetical protein
MKLALVPALVAALSLAGCTTSRAPLVLEPALETETLGEVLVLPVIDARPETYSHPDVGRNVGEAVIRFLRERGYYAVAADAWNARPDGPINLRVATAEQLIPLAPELAGYFMLVQVERLEPGVDLNAQTREARQVDQQEAGAVDSTAQRWDARVSAALIDRASSRVVWRDVATASSTLGGVLTVFAGGSVQNEAAVNASRLLVQTLPDKREKR